ncbi:MAG: CopG family transcriptional regulator [Verrucomicrobiota bacterium]
MKAEQLDDIFDSGADLIPHLDLSTVRRLNLEQKRVNVDLPIWMIQNLDREADRVGVTRQSIIKVWLAERLKMERSA